MTQFQFYDRLAGRFGISVQKVSVIVRNHKLDKRRIYGNMAVDNDAFCRIALQLGYVDSWEILDQRTED